ncbi:hypothetical protein DITRI_Ditri09bG0070300 [Diplodiscus trichospermus]
MASNSALLAVQYVAGIPALRYQPPRNLVAKAQRTSVIAANRAVKYEASYLLSSPSLLCRRSVTKRDKAMVAAYPETKTIEVSTSGFPESTDVHLENNSGINLKLVVRDIWFGSKVVPEIPEQIEAEGKFGHNVDYKAAVKRSAGCIGYQINDKKWIIAWKNATNETNKVYAVVTDGVYDPNEIKDELDKRSQPKIEDDQTEYHFSVEIDEYSPKPKLKAKISKKPPI